MLLYLLIGAVFTQQHIDEFHALLDEFSKDPMFSKLYEPVLKSSSVNDESNPTKIVSYEDSQIESGHFVVSLSDNVEKYHIDKTSVLLSTLGFDIKTTFDLFPGYHLFISDSLDNVNITDKFNLIPWVTHVEPDLTMKNFQTNEVQSELWALDRIDQRTLPLDGKFQFNGTGKGVNVYVIDSGIDSTHVEFGGRAKSVYVSPELGGSDGSDCTDSGKGHGTHVAGIIGGTNVGVAKLASINSLRVISCDGTTMNSQVVAALNWVAQNAVRPAVVSMSLGPTLNSQKVYPKSPSLDAAISAVSQMGIPVVVAAGNDNLDSCSGSPSGSPGAISIGATNQNDARASFSNFGPCLGMFAPGTGIYSAKPLGGYQVKQGTSQATPLVTGAVAILLEENPNMLPAEILSRLREIASPDVLSNIGNSPNLLLQMPIGVSDGNIDIKPRFLDFNNEQQSFWSTSQGIVSAIFITIGCLIILTILLGFFFSMYRKHPSKSTFESSTILVMPPDQHVSRESKTEEIVLSIDNSDTESWRSSELSFVTIDDIVSRALPRPPPPPKINDANIYEDEGDVTSAMEETNSRPPLPPKNNNNSEMNSFQHEVSFRRDSLGHWFDFPSNANRTKIESDDANDSDSNESEMVDLSSPVSPVISSVPLHIKKSRKRPLSLSSINN